MRTRLFLIAVCTLFFVNAQSQRSTVAGVVNNAKDQKGIAYVSIYIVKANTFFDTDENGRFSVDADITDTLLFSCIGYDKYKVAVKDLAANAQVALTERVYDLGNVVVKSSSPVTSGILNEKQTRSFSGEQQSEGFEFVNLIEAAENTTAVRVNKVFFKQKNFYPESPLRLHIYAVAENGLPGEELLKKQVIVKESDHKDGVIEINIKDQNLVVEGRSFFIGLQWVKLLTNDAAKGRKNDMGIAETNAVGKRVTYRKGRVLNYQWYAFYESGIYIPSKEPGKPGTMPVPVKGNPINILAAAEIDPL